MQKEQVHFGGDVPRGTSKNAKDKSNSATLRASLGGTLEGMNRRVSQCDLEKDSGYSESGSDLVQNDLDDKRSSVSEPHHTRNSSRSLGKMSPFKELSPICVINNLVVKQSGPEQLLHTPLVWGETWHSLSGSKAPTQLLFIQQPQVASPSPSNLLDPLDQPQKGGSRSIKNHTGKNSYLPILNSYPRIAPHPRKEGQGQGGTSGVGVNESGREGQTLSKRVCTEDQREVSTTAHLRPRHHHQREGRTHSHSIYKASSSQSSSPCLPHHSMGGPASSAQRESHHCRQHAKPRPSRSDTSRSDSLSVTSSSFSSSSSCAGSWAPEASADLSDCLSDCLSNCSSVRQRRFLNTAEILSQSGLLAIALRTKELLRQNAASEKELSQLRQHAQLLCLAAQATHSSQDAHCPGPDRNPSPLDKLLQAMSQSGCYPSLDWTHFKADGLDRPEKGDWADREKDKNNITNEDDRPSLSTLAGPLAYCDNRASPPSPLFALSPDPEERPDILASLLSPSPSPHLDFREQGRRQGGILCDLNITPDSSTTPGLYTDIF
ncbi:CLOCK-interacting pacemaker [Esox lucius]|nr:CLOCK-interacting pacemaker [Esox lucius]